MKIPYGLRQRPHVQPLTKTGNSPKFFKKSSTPTLLRY